MDHGGLDVPDRGHCPGKLVGLLRTWLGRLVVLGPSRERFFYALAGWDCADTFTRGNGEAWRLQELDSAACDRGVFLKLTRHVSRTLRCADFGTRLCYRSQAWHFHSLFPGLCDRRFTATFCLARQTGWVRIE